MISATIDRVRSARTYASLVKLFPPRVIHDRQARDATYAMIEKLMSLKSPAKGQLEFLDLLSTLVGLHEEREYPTPTVSHQAMLGHLIEAKGVSQATVAKETGVSRSTISDVLAARRTLVWKTCVDWRPTLAWTFECF